MEFHYRQLSPEEQKRSAKALAPVLAERCGYQEGTVRKYLGPIKRAMRRVTFHCCGMRASCPERCTGVGVESTDSTPTLFCCPGPACASGTTALRHWGSGRAVGERWGEARRRLRGGTL